MRSAIPWRARRDSRAPTSPGSRRAPLTWSIRLGSASGWIRLDQRPFATSAADLFAGNTRYPLDLDEQGNRISTDEIIPTGTGTDGTASGDNCGDWSDTSARVIGGDAFGGAMRWTQGFLHMCNGMTRLYCLGTDYDAPFTVAAPAGARLAFVSQATLSGDAGIAGADALCASEASTAGLTGTFQALLATTTASPASRFTPGSTWYRVDGIALWTSGASLGAGVAPMTPLMLEADGTNVGTALVFTGSMSPSSTATNDCADWSDATATQMGAVTLSDLISNWFQAGSRTCDMSHHVYCLQQ